MIRLPRILYAVPQLPHVHLEIAKAIHSLAVDDDEERRPYGGIPSTIKAAVDDPKHPGWPAGTPDGKGGQFRPKDSAINGADQVKEISEKGKKEPTLAQPPQIPKSEPATARAVNTFLKAAAYFLAEAALVDEPAGVAFLVALQAARWLSEFLPWIIAYQDPPKTLEELQQDLRPLDGYDVHHIVEQTSAGQDGFPKNLINSPENLVRIPTLTHWLITAWFATKSNDYGGVSPRDYLSGKSWQERMRVGKDALIRFGVLKP